MSQRIDRLPVVLTSFAYRKQYHPELDGMMASVREHHPDWLTVVGRGPVEGFELPTLEVELPGGRVQRWTAPLPIPLDGDKEEVWRKINLLKAWWVAQVWRKCEELGVDWRRILWLDADARLAGPLDIEVEPDAEVVAGPWWYDPDNSAYDGVRGGILLFQGAKGGKVETLVEAWSAGCQEHIKNLPPRVLPWPEADQEVLRDVLRQNPPRDHDYDLLRLDHNRYCGHLTIYDAVRPGTLVIHWLMSAQMWLPEDKDRPWPPPEDYRRRVAEMGGFPQKPVPGGDKEETVAEQPSVKSHDL